MQSRRESYIELLRFIAAVGIVFFHSQTPGYEFCHAGVAFFAGLTGGMAFRSPNRRVPLIASRLLIAWAFWWLTHTAVNVLETLLKDPAYGWASEFRWPMLFYGPSIYLWYLPFAFVATVAVSAIGRRMSGSAAALVFTATFLASLAAIADLRHEQWISPFSEWANTIPAVLAGVAIYSATTNCGSLLALAACLGALVGARHNGLFSSHFFVSYVTGLSTLASIRFISIPQSHTIERLGALSLGIYLTHPLVMLVSYRIFPVRTGFAFTAGVVLGSMAAATILRRLRLPVV